MISSNRKHNRKYFYKYTSITTAASILIDKRLRLCSPLLFNDPFDIPRILSLSFTGGDLAKAVLDELIRLAQDSTYEIVANRIPRIRQYLGWMRTFTPEHYRNLAEANKAPVDITERMEDLPSFVDMQKQWTASLPKTRILCLTEENDNPVMWSSYASNYEGVVLEIECLDIYDSFLLLAKPVNYTDEPPTIGTLQYWTKQMTGQIDFDYGATFAELEITKQTKWAYEKEWRVNSFEKSGTGLYSDYDMHSSSFTMVFLGKNTAPFGSRTAPFSCRSQSFALGNT
jgi:hypothetical protein